MVYFFLPFFPFEKFVIVTASPGFLTPSVTLKIMPASAAVIPYQYSFLKFFALAKYSGKILTYRGVVWGEAWKCVIISHFLSLSLSFLFPISGSYLSAKGSAFRVFISHSNKKEGYCCLMLISLNMNQQHTHSPTNHTLIRLKTTPHFFHLGLNRSVTKEWKWVLCVLETIALERGGGSTHAL